MVHKNVAHRPDPYYFQDRRWKLREMSFVQRGLQSLTILITTRGRSTRPRIAHR